MGALALLKKSFSAPAKLENALAKRAENLPSSRELTPLQIKKRDERWLFCSMVVELQRQTGQKRQECCQIVAARDSNLFPILTKSGQGGKSQLTYSNFRNWLQLLGKKGKDYDWSNRDALVDCYNSGIQKLYGDENFWKLFRAFYLSQQQLSMAEARRLAMRKSREINPFAVIPSIDQIKYRVRQWDPTMVALARMGEEYVKNHHLSYINRDWSDVRVNEIWFSDHRVFDLPVKVWNKEKGKWEAVRPWLCAFTDAKSWYMVSWQITTESPNNETIRNGLALGISRHGRPAHLYIDNGKDFKKQGFSEPVKFGEHEHSILNCLGIDCITSLPYNGRAKTIERGFRNHAESFDKMFAGYLGNKPSARPDSAHYFYKNPEQLPTLEEFTQMFQSFLEDLHNRVNTGKIVGNRTPKDAFYNGARLEKAPMNDIELYAAFLLPEPQLRQVRRGYSVTIGKKIYYGECLMKPKSYLGKKVMIKTDRFNPEHVYAFEPDGKPIGECKTRKAIKALALTDDDRRMISEAMKEQRDQMKRCYTMLNEATGGLHLLSPVELLALPDNFDIVKLGSTRSVKGASHTFSNYKAIDLDKPETEKNIFDFKEDKREKRAEDFKRKAVMKDVENSISTDAETMNQFFKIAVKKQGDNDYDY
jgi:transposase InsO family protein